MIRTVAVALLMALTLTLVSCKGDPSKPEYWEKAISGAKNKKEKLKRVDELRSYKGLNKSFLPVLHKRLADEKSAEVKGKIAQIIGELKDPSSVDSLVDAIDWTAAEGDTKGMNKEIAEALGKIGDPKGSQALLKCLNLKDNYTVISAVEGLGNMRAKDAVEALVKFATDENTEPFLSKKAIQALGDIADPKATDALIRMMYKERRGVSFYVEASFALYQIGTPAADALLPILENSNKEMLSWAEKNGILAPALPAKAAQVLGDLHDMRAEKGLLALLKFNNEMLDIKLFVRMRAADALGRLRSTAGAKALADMLDEEEATAKEEYVRALTRIGGRDGIANMTKAASKGSWDARQGAMWGISMVGDERDLAAFNKFADDETKLFTAECKDDDGVKGCSNVAAAVKEHVEKITKNRKVLDAAKECKSDAACWAKKLTDGHEGVRARAGYEVGRSKNAALVTELMKHLTEENLETRLADHPGHRLARARQQGSGQGGDGADRRARQADRRREGQDRVPEGERGSAPPRREDSPVGVRHVAARGAVAERRGCRGHLVERHRLLDDREAARPGSCACDARGGTSPRCSAHCRRGAGRRRDAAAARRQLRRRQGATLEAGPGVRARAVARDVAEHGLVDERVAQAQRDGVVHELHVAAGEGRGDGASGGRKHAGLTRVDGEGGEIGSVTAAAQLTGQDVALGNRHVIAVERHAVRDGEHAGSARRRGAASRSGLGVGARHGEVVRAHEHVDGSASSEHEDGGDEVFHEPGLYGAALASASF